MADAKHDRRNAMQLWAVARASELRLRAARPNVAPYIQGRMGKRDGAATIT